MHEDPDPTRFCPKCGSLVQESTHGGRQLTYVCHSRVNIVNEHRQDFHQSGQCRQNLSDLDVDDTLTMMTERPGD